MTLNLRGFEQVLLLDTGKGRSYNKIHTNVQFLAKSVLALAEFVSGSLEETSGRE